MKILDAMFEDGLFAAMGNRTGWLRRRVIDCADKTEAGGRRGKGGLHAGLPSCSSGGAKRSATAMRFH